MPTLEQIRAARALLGWSQSDLADRAGLSQTGIARIENGTNHPNSQTLTKIEKAFEENDIEFLGSTGLRKKTDEVKTLHGTDGFKEFMHDVYNTAKAKGGTICLHNARPSNWVKWLGVDWFEMHADRMKALGNKIDYRITAEEGTTNLISSAFAEYRWFPRDMFNQQSVYAYDSKLAFVTFKESDVVIRILDNKEFADGYRILFNIAWETVAIKIPDVRKVG
ncbi:MAG: helix-turn-helix domain-containing protein [Alphaproteobacteria bacterium]